MFRMPIYSTPQPDEVVSILSDEINKIQQEESHMNFMEGMFGKVGNGMCRLSIDGNIAIKTPNGYRTYDAKTKGLINCNDFCFDVGQEMFFIIPTNKVEVGDIIFSDKAPKYVIKVEDGNIIALNYKTGVVETLVPERYMFMGETYFYGKIVSLFNGFTGGDKAQNIMKYMIMSQMFGGGNGTGMGNVTSNPMMMMMLMGGNNGMGSMLDGLFGNNTTTAVTKEENA